MIRLVALACGLMCGAGFALSGLYDPGLPRAFLMPQANWNFSLGLGLLVAMITACLVVILSGKRDKPLLCGECEPLPCGTGWKPLAGALLFGLGWGISGYVPLTGMASAAMLSPGAPIFLVSVLGGMVLNDLIAAGRKPKDGRRISRG